MYDDFVAKIGKDDDRFMRALRVNVYRLYIRVPMQIYVYDLTCVIRFDC